MAQKEIAIAAEAVDEAPDFDISPDPARIKEAIEQPNSLNWQSAIGRTALVGLSRQLHDLLHKHDPAVIGPQPGPYSNAVVTKVFSSYMARNRHQLSRPGESGIIYTSNIPEFRLIMGREQLPFSDLAAVLRRHLVLLDIVD